MTLQTWFKARSPRFIWQRAASLLGRYGVTPGKAAHRIDHCIETLAELGCAPTFPTPGIVVEHHPQFVRHLQNAGAEIAVHSYQHLDLSTMPVPSARQQLLKAVRTFERFGIEVHGFRCPYLGCSTALLDSLPADLFGYGSNEAVYWELPVPAANNNLFFETLCRFYKGKPAADTLCLPSYRSNLIEIPVCIPDDLELHDGLHLGSEATGQVWGDMLEQIYRRGELFTLMFHPELASFCEYPFKSLLQRARQYRPLVWNVRLCDVSEWWREKSCFRLESSMIANGLRLSFICSPRATILARGMEPRESWQPWDGKYFSLQSNTIDVPADPLPFVGLPTSAPGPVVSFLQEQGYIVDTSDTARRCAIWLDTGTLGKLNEVQLVDFIETAPGPLVRYWRWPAGAKCALCITGDLDALTLLDYSSRLFVH